MDLSSPDIFPQIVISLLIVATIYIAYMIVETLYRSYLGYNKVRIPVYPYTGSSTKAIVVKQDPNNPASKTLNLSENQLTGIEFSYSFFLYVADDTDSNLEGWKTVFYKGYESGPFPLQGPGVYISSKSESTGSPTLRVVMNSYDKWFNKVDVKQIPFNKWMHIAIVLRSNTLEVYVNGNLANKLTFNGTLPYQNYQPLNIFPNSTTSETSFKSADAGSTKHGLPANENFIIRGKFTGYLSNLYYFSYAMTYSEIQGMLNIGPSSEFSQESMDKPPYLIDSWWTQRKG
jgi:hypothetical protein